MIKDQLVSEHRWKWKRITNLNHRTTYQFQNDLIVAVSTEERPQSDDDDRVKSHPRSPLPLKFQKLFPSLGGRLSRGQGSAQLGGHFVLICASIKSRRRLYLRMEMEREAENGSENREGTSVISTVQTLDVWGYGGFNIHNACRAWLNRNSDLVTIYSDIDSDAPPEHAPVPVDSKLRVPPEFRRNSGVSCNLAYRPPRPHHWWLFRLSFHSSLLLS